MTVTALGLEVALDALRAANSRADLEDWEITQIQDAHAQLLALLVAMSPGPRPLPEPADVAGLAGLLEITGNFTTAEQRARYVLSSDWCRDRDARLAATAAPDAAALRLRLLGEVTELRDACPTDAAGGRFYEAMVMGYDDALDVIRRAR